MRKVILSSSCGSNPDLSRNDRWERGDSMSIVSNLPQTGSLERHRILSESLPPHCDIYADCLCTKIGFKIITPCYFQVPPKWTPPFFPMTAVINQGSLAPPPVLDAQL